ncbi:Geranylgeranyl transferase type-1 subunit beta [Rhizophlyctis rosea]|uniref:Geranylgeranyl transferase type-1 subunit beta n=1 Tax=Rhizophlyctis rosea TaxID=64517 RepID=A0AAD5SB49_9FUNG|nr:Geranylgeranyl transferase type-1 subunit beta [Rhizophlyctis rosea]
MSDGKARDRSNDILYFKRHLELLPDHYTSTDTNRMTLAYFGISALDLLGVLEEETSGEERSGWVEWVYAQQVHPNEGREVATQKQCGFRGAPYAGAVFDSTNSKVCNPYDTGHLAMTYTALAILIILGDDLSRVNREAIVSSMKDLQQADGSFVPCPGSSESDMRFLFCACAISYMLNDWSGVDRERALEFVRKSESYEHAFGQQPDQEAHGGSTYCAIAALTLLSALPTALQNQDKTVAWLLNRQRKGFHGRPDKPDDTCYAFWVGASLKMLDAYQFVDTQALREFLETTRTKYGGYGKVPEAYPDLLHSYMGLSGLALQDDTKREGGSRALYGPLGISERALGWLREGTIYWRKV